MSSGELHQKRVFSVKDNITDVGLSESSAHMIPPGCVLIGLAGQGKTRGTVAVNMIELSTNQSIGAILPSEMHDTFYLFYNLESRYWDLRNLSTGDGGRGGLNLFILNHLSIPLPPLPEQKAIAKVLSGMDTEIEALEQKRNKYKQIKQGMMDQLLTGKVRLI
jgi:type I restriction enzyme S subunit